MIDGRAFIDVVANTAISTVTSVTCACVAANAIAAGGVNMAVVQCIRCTLVDVVASRPVPSVSAATDAGVASGTVYTVCKCVAIMMAGRAFIDVVANDAVSTVSGVTCAVILGASDIDTCRILTVTFRSLTGSLLLV